MKKAIYFIAAIAAIAACSKNEVSPNIPGNEALNPVSSLTVTSAPVTRTSINGNLQILWSDGDQIAVYSNKLEADELATPFTISGSGGSNTATFTGGPLDCAEYGIAVYPYEKDGTGSDKYRKLQTTGTVTTWVPKVQHYVEGSIPGESLVMAARFDPKVGEMTFTALASVLEVPLYGDISVSNIRVEEYATADATSVGGKNLCGQVKITFDENGVPSSKAVETSYLDLVCDTPVALKASAADATSFFIVLAGNATFNHLNVIITDTDGSFRTIKVGGKEETTTLAPGTVYTLPAKEVKKPSAEILAGWKLDANYAPGEFLVGSSSSPVALSATGNATASLGKGYLVFKNNDMSTFRTAYSNKPSSTSQHLVIIPASKGDEIIFAATDCSLSSGDKVKFLGCIWAYASGKQVSSANTSKEYEFGYSQDGTTWTKIKTITFSANMSSAPKETTDASADIDETVTLTKASDKIMFRFLATSDEGTGNGGPITVESNGQTRLSYGSNEQLSILKL